MYFTPPPPPPLIYCLFNKCIINTIRNHNSPHESLLGRPLLSTLMAKLLILQRINPFPLGRYSVVPLLHGTIFHNITCNIATTAAEHKSDFQLTKDTPYLALRDEIRGVYCENFGEKWHHYISTTLYYCYFKSNQLLKILLSINTINLILHMQAL